MYVLPATKEPSVEREAFSTAVQGKEGGREGGECSEESILEGLDESEGGRSGRR